MPAAPIIAFAAFVIVIAGTVPHAVAQSPFCLPLQMELAELERYGGSGLSGDQSALRRQLDQALAEERRAGCRGLFRDRSSRNTCRSIRSHISSLERQLNGPRGGFFGFSRSPVERRRASIRDALRRNGCSTYAASGFRTICVRLCDGYYYPLSNTSSRQRIAQDAGRCMSQYGPHQASLFYHPYPNGDISQAISLDGERYFNQPFAFAYRTQYMPHCAAQLHTGLAALGERLQAAALVGENVAAPRPASLGEQFEAAARARMEIFSVPIPIARSDRSSDPETISNRAGRFVAARFKAPEPEPSAVSEPEVALIGQASRSVGEPYYFVETNPGPPATVAGYKPPELKDFRVPKRASILPVTR